MIPKQMVGFLADVVKESESGNLKWERDQNFGQDRFSCNQNGFELEIWTQWNDDLETMFINFSIETPDKERGVFSTSSWEEDYPQMRILYEVATISAASITPESLKGFFRKS